MSFLSFFFSCGHDVTKQKQVGEVQLTEHNQPTCVMRGCGLTQVAVHIAHIVIMHCTFCSMHMVFAVEDLGIWEGSYHT